MALAMTANFADLLDPAFRKIFFDSLERVPRMYDKIFRIESSTRNYEKESQVSSTGKWTEKNEGTSVDYGTIWQGYDKTYTHRAWSKGFEITREMYDDDLTGAMKNEPAQLGIGAAITVDDECMSVFNNAFSGSYLGGDSKALCASDHPRADGGATQSNTATAVLSESSLETAIVAGLGYYSNAGTLVPVYFDTLIVPPALEKEAVILLKSILRPGFADNDTNKYLQDRMKILVCPRLTSTTAWFLVDSNIHQLKLFWRQKPEFDSWNDFDTGNAKFKGYMRFSYGWSDWRGVYGSTGAG